MRDVAPNDGRHREGVGRVPPEELLPFIPGGPPIRGNALTKPVLEPSTEGGGRSKKTGPQPVAARADLPNVLGPDFDLAGK